MTRLVFVLGKNWILSIAEVVTLLQDKGYDPKVIDNTRNGMIVEIEGDVTDEQIVHLQSQLGGCYKTGRLIRTYTIDLIRDAFPDRSKGDRSARKLLAEVEWTHKIWPRPNKKSISFGVSTYPPFERGFRVHLQRLTRSLDQYIKKDLLDRGAKSVDYIIYEKPDRRDSASKNTALWPKAIAKHNLLVPPNAEIIAIIAERDLYLAKSIAVYDSMLQRYRDEARPYISNEISTSPKLCRTLLTLSGAREGDTVLDPFCGSGTLLMEAALLGMKCIGLDVDGDAVEGTRSNLKWLARDLDMPLDFRVYHGNARNLTKTVSTTVDAAAFEPDLGPIYTKRPEKAKAIETIRDLTELYCDAIQEISKILNPRGRIAMTLPNIQTRSGEVMVRVDELLEGTNLVVYKMLPSSVFHDSMVSNKKLKIIPDRTALIERKRGQIVQRSVIMLGRP
ncbi:methyltransferase domain-containing protein [Candidatus Thorarchaeota archaeon]|nr:MAG: methyltransferase domain-containing protein [Candidatus Thorarchaeota archaeon]